MTSQISWLLIYLAAGALVLWTSRNSSACRVRSRMERNGRITSVIGSLLRSKS